MPKLKTHSGAKKRFNLTKTGKVKRAKAFTTTMRLAVGLMPWRSSRSTLVDSSISFIAQ